MTRRSGLVDGSLWVVLGIALLLRALLPLVVIASHHDAPVFSAPDTESYVRPAQAVLFLYHTVRYIKQGKVLNILTGTLTLAGATYVGPGIAGNRQ